MKGGNNKGSDLRMIGALVRTSSRLCCLLTFAFLLFPLSSFAQDDGPEAPPPPLKLVSKEEQSKLDSKKDVKDRAKLSLELMTARLSTAERYAGASDFESMYRELGHFHALMDDAVEYLNKRDDGKKGSVLDSFKRLGIALRGMAPKIEVIRRELPIKFDTYVRKLLGYLRLNREKATDSLFGDSVVPNKKPNR